MIYANKTRQELTVSSKMKSKASKSVLPFHQDLQEIILNWFKIHPHKHVISDKHGKYLNPKQLEYTENFKRTRHPLSFSYVKTHFSNKTN